KVVVVGNAPVSTGVNDFALARYNADGSLDTTFGTGGKVTTDFGGGHASADAVAVQNDGKIVAAGHAYSAQTNWDFALTRYNSDGHPDTSFGSGGKVTTDFSAGDDHANAVILQSDGKIVVAGLGSNATTAQDFGLARYNADGSLDTTFGVGGKVT